MFLLKLANLAWTSFKLNSRETGAKKILSRDELVMDVALSFILFQPSSFRLSRANTKKANVPTQPGSGNAASAWLMEQRSSLDYVRFFLSSFRFDAPRFCRDEKMASGTSKWYPIRFIPSFTVRESRAFGFLITLYEILKFVSYLWSRDLFKDDFEQNRNLYKDI